MKILKKIALATVFAAGLAAGNAQALLLDDFSTGAAVFPFGIGAGHDSANIDFNTDTQTTTLANALGSTRQLDVQRQNLGVGDDRTVDVDAGFDGTFTINSVPGALATSTITWSNFLGTNASVDFTDSGDNALLLRLPTVVDQAMTIVATFFNAANDSASSSVFVPNSTAIGDFTLLYGDFTVDAGFLFTSVSYVTLDIIAEGAGLDLTLNLIETTKAQNVPEPGSLLLLISGLLVGFSVKKRIKAY